MALIRELEPTPRGVYCGAIGWVGPPDAPVRARFNVAIRTAVVDRATGAAVYGSGGGITWSSDPHAEHAEVLHKTAILNRRHRPFELLETMLPPAGPGRAAQPGPAPAPDGHLGRVRRVPLRPGAASWPS